MDNRLFAAAKHVYYRQLNILINYNKATVSYQLQTVADGSLMTVNYPESHKYFVGNHELLMAIKKQMRQVIKSDSEMSDVTVVFKNLESGKQREQKDPMRLGSVTYGEAVKELTLFGNTICNPAMQRIIEARPIDPDKLGKKGCCTIL